ncbi:hypothetical protein ACFYTQ_08680 [Nocardia sp. NPDC004068]|uniref:hypothetical protein n=1 Tax=Nocardia sp. NPDC004068 TaxID=3364303 RepID=UPI0036998BF7
MSQHSATGRRTTTRRSVQILQHTAIVTAGMASIGLTVAAGTYIVNQIAQSGLGPGTEFSEPGAGRVEPGPADEPRVRESGTPATISTPVGLVVETRRLPDPVAEPPLPAPVPVAPAAPAPASAATAATPQTGPAPLRVRLPGDTYVGANVVRDQPDSLTMTVDTNVPAAVTTALTQRPGSAGVTRLSTGVDTRSGRITVTLTDPALGDRSVRWADPAV